MCVYKKIHKEEKIGGCRVAFRPYTISLEGNEPPTKEMIEKLDFRNTNIALVNTTKVQQNQTQEESKCNLGGCLNNNKWCHKEKHQKIKVEIHKKMKHLKQAIIKVVHLYMDDIN